MGQAKDLSQSQVHIDGVVELSLNDELIVERLSGRKIHPGSGRTYHRDFNPPKVEGQDDETGEPLVQREDDTPEIIRHRLEVYHRLTEPVLAVYQALPVRWVRVDGGLSADEVTKKLIEAIE